jgi:hypothetical protein
MYDIIITIARKDFNKLQFVVSSIIKNVPGFHNIYCISNISIPDRYRIDGIQCFIDDEVIDFDFFNIRMVNRRGWYRQQFIKLFQGITADNYLVIDGDVYINKPMEINTAHPYFLLGRDQHHLPYFQFMKDVFNLDQMYPHSFISEMMFFKRGMIGFMLDELKVDKYQFFNICAKEINKLNDPSGFSEYELYGNYVTKNWPDLYQYKQLKTIPTAKKREWTDDEIREHIRFYSRGNYDLLTMHSWI